VGHHPSGVAYDSAKGEIYIINYEDNTVSVASWSTPPTTIPSSEHVFFALIEVVVLAVVLVAVSLLLLRRRRVGKSKIASVGNLSPMSSF
jgi:hypothetical protein